MESHKLYVGNIKHSMTEQDLREVFSGFGDLREVKVIRDRGFGFVTYATLEEAEEARKMMAGREFEGRTLTRGRRTSHLPKREKTIIRVAKALSVTRG